MSLSNAELREVHAQQDDDRAWFTANPERQFRVRRALVPGEVSGEPPSDDKTAFVIVNRNCIGECWMLRFFVEHPSFDAASMSDKQARVVVDAIEKYEGHRC